MIAARRPHGARAACAFTFDLDAESLRLARGVTEPGLWVARPEQIAAHTRTELA